MPHSKVRHWRYQDTSMVQFKEHTKIYYVILRAHNSGDEDSKPLRCHTVSNGK